MPKKQNYVVRKGDELVTGVWQEAGYSEAEIADMKKVASRKLSEKDGTPTSRRGRERKWTLDLEMSLFFDVTSLTDKGMPISKACRAVADMPTWRHTAVSMGWKRPEKTIRERFTRILATCLHFQETATGEVFLAVAQKEKKRGRS